MDERVAELNSGFDHFLDVFTHTERFTGPSWYFHRRTLRRRAEHGSIASLLKDDLYFDLLYATLTAWGLHRMGPGKTKLLELDEIRASIADQAHRLDELAALTITDIPQAERPRLAEQVWSVLTRLRVSKATVQIVANSKALHHLVPNLVPPVDREYTFRFFYKRTGLSIDERTAFAEMFTRILRVASEHRVFITAALETAWQNTSPAKAVDNAIVGYMIDRERMEPPSNAPDPAALADP